MEGDPLPQPRPKGQLIQGKGKPFIHIYTPSGTKGCHTKWREAVWTAAQIILPDEPLDVPIVLTINIYVPRPGRMMAKKHFDGPIPHPVRGDIDNYAKAIMDALGPVEATKTKKGRRGLWTDDGLVFVAHLSKWYTARDNGPGAYVLIETIDPASQVNFPSRPLLKGVHK